MPVGSTLSRKGLLKMDGYRTGGVVAKVYPISFSGWFALYFNTQHNVSLMSVPNGVCNINNNNNNNNDNSFFS